MVSDWEFIEVAARDFGVGGEAIRKWRSRGVPGKFRLPIFERARREGFELDPSAFEPASAAKDAAAEAHGSGEKPCP